jgi:hypothetical protein
MDEILHRNFRREEEFVEKFRSSAWKASQLLDGAWKPQSNCDDTERNQCKHRLLIGKQSHLVFKSATVYHDPGNRAFTSARIFLESSSRIVEVRVKKEHDRLVARTILDRVAEPRDAVTTYRQDGRHADSIRSMDYKLPVILVLVGTGFGAGCIWFVFVLIVRRLLGAS